MNYKTLKHKQSKQAKNLRSPKKAVGTVQTADAKDVWEQLLFMRTAKLRRLELAYRSSMGESVIRSLLKIRLESFKATMLQLQHKPGGDGSRLLRKNVKGNRSGSDGTTPKRQTSKRQSFGLLSTKNRRIREVIAKPTTLKFKTKDGKGISIKATQTYLK